MTIDDIPVERAFKSLSVWLFHNAKNFVFLGTCFYGVLVWSIQPRFEAYAAEFVLKTVDEQIGALERGQAALESTLGDVKAKQDRVIETQQGLASQLDDIAEQIESQQKIQRDTNADILRLLDPGKFENLR